MRLSDDPNDAAVSCDDENVCYNAIYGFNIQLPCLQIRHDRINSIWWSLKQIKYLARLID